jgi:hypothetical protein
MPWSDISSVCVMSVVIRIMIEGMILSDPDTTEGVCGCIAALPLNHESQHLS